MLTFMYSTCQDTCPVTATHDPRRARRPRPRRARLCAVSVDPANDTPDSAEAFLVKRGLSAGRMRFLLGTRAQLAPIWNAYGIRPQGNGFEHSAYVLLIDKRGRQRISFPVDQLIDRDLAHDIRKLEARARRQPGASSSPGRGVAAALAALLDPQHHDDDDDRREVEQRVYQWPTWARGSAVIAPLRTGARARGW